MSFRRPPSDVDRMTSIKVDNLPYSAYAEDLKPLFEKFGDVGDIYIPTDRESGRSRGFAYVRYYDKRDAEDAMDSGEFLSKSWLLLQSSNPWLRPYRRLYGRSHGLL